MPVEIPRNISTASSSADLTEKRPVEILEVPEKPTKKRATPKPTKGVNPGSLSESGLHQNEATGIMTTSQMDKISPGSDKRLVKIEETVKIDRVYFFE